MTIARASFWVTGREGGEYVTDPYPSRWGISLHYHPELTQAAIEAMTQANAAQIMATQYWPKNADLLPDYLSIPLLSFAVLAGPGTGVEQLQRALVVNVDGGIGPQTEVAAKLANEGDLLEAFFGECIAHLMQSPRWTLDGVGWARRQMRASMEALT